MNTFNTPHTNQWCLLAVSPELSDLSMPLGVTTSVGRHHNNDIFLASPQVSRHHAKFNQIGSSLVVQDLGSSNGTFVNGERIATEAVELATGDEVAFADILFVIRNETDIEGGDLMENPALNQIETNQVKTATGEKAEAEILTEVVPLPATVVAPLDNVEKPDVAEQVARDKVESDTIEAKKIEADKLEKVEAPAVAPAQSAIQPIAKTEIVPTEPEVIKLENIKPIADTPTQATKPATSIKNTLTEQVISPIVSSNSTDSQSTTVHKPTAVPQKAPVQTWLVALAIVILIVLAIIGTMFLK